MVRVDIAGEVFSSRLAPFAALPQPAHWSAPQADNDSSGGYATNPGTTVKNRPSTGATGNGGFRAGNPVGAREAVQDLVLLFDACQVCVAERAHHVAVLVKSRDSASPNPAGDDCARRTGWSRNVAMSDPAAIHIRAQLAGTARRSAERC